MEQIVRDFIMEHFLTNGFLSDKQYGFIKERLTVLQLLKILDDWTSQLDAGKQVDVIYTDFEKAFDKVPHHALINKLLAYGLDNTLVQWIKDFLCSRKQRVGINGFFSQWFSVDSGITQGSILGPILFLALMICQSSAELITIYIFMQMMLSFTILFHLERTRYVSSRS